MKNNLIDRNKHRQAARDAYLERKDNKNVQCWYDVSASDYEFYMPTPWRIRAQRFDRFMSDHIGRVNCVVELGVGSGRLVSKIDARFRIGLDIAKNMCKEARKSQVTTIQGDQACLPLKEASIEAVTSGNASGRYTPLEVFLGEIARALRDRGRFAIHLFPDRTLSLRALAAPWKTDRRYQYPPPPEGCSNFPPWSEARALFARAGLWIEDQLMLRRLSRSPYYIPIIPPSAMILAHEVAVAGIRMQRNIVDLHNRIIDDIYQTGKCTISTDNIISQGCLGNRDIMTVITASRLRRKDVVVVQYRDYIRADEVLTQIKSGGRELLVIHCPESTSKHKVIPRWQVIGRVVD